MHFLSRKRRLIIEAIFCLCLSRFALLCISFQRLASYMGFYLEESSQSMNERNKMTAQQIAQAIRSARKLLPWESTCLSRSMAAMAMLARRKQDSTLYFGVGKNENNRLIAHAWLRTGNIFIVGGRQRHNFTKVGYFTKFTQQISKEP